MNGEQKKIREFTDLVVWQECHKLVLLIYKTTAKFPKAEIFGMTSQMRRSAVSITSNIAEGFGRHGYKEKVQFYYLAHGSLLELKNQLYIARDVSYLSEADFNICIKQLATSHSLLQAFISKTKTFLNPESHS